MDNFIMKNQYVREIPKNFLFLRQDIFLTLKQQFNPNDRTKQDNKVQKETGHF